MAEKKKKSVSAQRRYTSGNPVFAPPGSGEGGLLGGVSIEGGTVHHDNAPVSPRFSPMNPSQGSYIDYLNLPYSPSGYSEGDIRRLWAEKSGRPAPSAPLGPLGSADQVGMNYSAQPPAVRRDMEAQRMAAARMTGKSAVNSSMASVNPAAVQVRQQQQQRKKRNDRAQLRDQAAEQQVPRYDLRSILWGY